MENIVGKQKRFFWMGLAIIAVILFHLVLFIERVEGEISPIAKILFGNGYLGVDLFMFLSVFGLSCSLSKNKGYSYSQYGQYFKRRIKRIFPPYLFYLLLVFAIIQQDKSIGEYAKIIICQCSGLSALSSRHFSCDAEWFTPALLLVYWLFPGIFALLNKIHKKIHNELLLDLAILIILSYTYMYWSYLATWNLTARLPIMYMGYCTWLYMKAGNKRGLLILYIASAILAYISFVDSRSIFLPLLLMALDTLNMKIPKRIYRLISLIGIYSFEVYLGQCIGTKYFMQSGRVDNIAYRIICAVLLTLMFSLFFVFVSKISYASNKHTRL